MSYITWLENNQHQHIHRRLEMTLKLTIKTTNIFDYHNYFSYYSSIVFRMRQYKYRKQFKKLYVNIARYFRQWNAWTHQGTIWHELLSMGNFATFHQIYSNICLKSSRYVLLPIKLDRVSSETKWRQNFYTILSNPPDILIFGSAPPPSLFRMDCRPCYSNRYVGMGGMIRLSNRRLSDAREGRLHMEGLGNH